MATAKEESSVKVYVRFRPLNNREKTLQTDSDIKFDFTGDNKSLRMTYNHVTTSGKAMKDFDFACDRVFQQDSTQEQVFEEVAREMVEEVIKGYNGTIFAYGQTGSGKTHCMFGPGKEKKQLGIIPRAADYIFEVLAGDPEIAEATIKISLLEIYREDIKDLFVPSDTSLKIRETPSGASYVAGLHEEYVASGEELMALLEIGSTNRSVASTNMNETSSRSHCVLIVTVTTKTRDGTVRVGKLNLADLAGSEKVKSTGATGQTLKEAQMINQSLSSLGNCINALTDAKRSHVPYRDSKLTFLLKDSLGGNTKTALMVACSPAAINGEETLSTLKFAQRAKLVQNTVCVNAEMSVAQLQEICEGLRKQIQDLKTANPDKSADALEAMTKERDQLLVQLRVATEAKTKIEDEFKFFKEHMVKNWTAAPAGEIPPGQPVTRGRSVSHSSASSGKGAAAPPPPPAGDDYANNPFGAAPAPAAKGAAPPPPPGATGAAPPPPKHGAPPPPKSEEKKGGDESDADASDSEAEASEEDVPTEVRITQEDTKEERVMKLMKENVRLEKEVQSLKAKLTETHKQLRMKNVGAAGAKIVKPVGGSHASRAKEVMNKMFYAEGEHMITDEILSHSGDKIAHFVVKSCCCSLDATTAFVGGLNALLQPFQKALKTGKIEAIRHHWIEVTLPVGFVLIQKHPSGCITMDYAADAASVREMALEAAGMQQSNTPVGQEDIKVEEEDNEAGHRTLDEVTKHVQAQPAKYSRVDLNSKKFALDVAKWYKSKGASEAKS